MMAAARLWLIWLFSSPVVFSQHLAPFDLLRYSFDAPLSALGQVHLTHASDHLAYAWQNPAMRTRVDSALGLRTPKHRLNVGAAIHHAGAWGGESTYAWNQNKHNVVVGIRYFSYGQLAGYDASGLAQGSFSAGTQLFLVSYSHTIGPFALGIGFKPLIMYIDQYATHHAYVDLGGTYHHPKADLSIGIALKHVPVYRIRSEYFNHDSTTDLWLGISYRPLGFPLRFSVHAHDLLHQNYYYEDDAVQSIHQRKPNAWQTVVSKLTFATEALIGRYVVLMAGYNRQKHQHLRIPDAGGLSGLSFGAALNVHRFNLSARTAFDRLRKPRVHVTLGMHLGRPIQVKKIKKAKKQKHKKTNI